MHPVILQEWTVIDQTSNSHLHHHYDPKWIIVDVNEGLALIPYRWIILRKRHIHLHFFSIFRDTDIDRVFEIIFLHIQSYGSWRSLYTKMLGIRSYGMYLILPPHSVSNTRRVTFTMTHGQTHLSPSWPPTIQNEQSISTRRPINQIITK